MTQRNPPCKRHSPPTTPFEKHKTSEPASRIFIRKLDRWLRALQGVYEFSADPLCLLRISVEKAPYDLRLPNGEIEKGAPTVDLHFMEREHPADPGGGSRFRLGAEGLSHAEGIVAGRVSRVAI